MKKLIALVVLFTVGISADPRINLKLTIASGTPVQLSAFPIRASEILIQMAAGGTGLGYVFGSLLTGTPSEL